MDIFQGNEFTKSKNMKVMNINEIYFVFKWNIKERLKERKKRNNGLGEQYKMKEFVGIS